MPPTISNILIMVKNPLKCIADMKEEARLSGSEGGIGIKFKKKLASLIQSIEKHSVER